jgi:hypothetical protein
MKLPSLSKDKKRPEPQPDEAPAASEKSKWKPKVVFYQGLLAPRKVEKGAKTAPMPGEISSSRPETGTQAAPPAEPNSSMDTSPETASQAGTQPGDFGRSSSQGIPTQAAKEDNPGRRLLALEASAKKAPPAKIPLIYRLLPKREQTHRAYWDIAATLSLIVNAILVGLVIIMAGQIKNLKTTMNNLLGGLYGNFVKMDDASINTTIMVDAQIPLDFNLPVSQNTTVVLTQDVDMSGAHVVINTGGLAIDALANVTLPAGTALPIALNLNIPVQSTIPISLQVPVSIPLSRTELHDPFTGLQTTLRPLYCLLNKNAQYPDGIYICAEHDTPTPGTP